MFERFLLQSNTKTETQTTTWWGTTTKTITQIIYILTSQPVAYKHDHGPTQSQRVSSMFEKNEFLYTQFWAGSSTHSLFKCKLRYQLWKHTRQNITKIHKELCKRAEIQSQGGSCFLIVCVQLWKYIWVFPKIGVPLKWMVYNGKPY